jgi:hypothetical protein
MVVFDLDSGLTPPIGLLGLGYQEAEEISGHLRSHTYPSLLVDLG